MTIATSIQSSIQIVSDEAPAIAASETEERYLVWGAGLLPPVFVRPIFVRSVRRSA